MSTTSDSDEANEYLKEAVDPTFFSNDLYQSKKQTVVKEKPVKSLPSLRTQDQPSTFNPLEIRVTPEFRAHVAKHLTRKLDGLICYTEEPPVIKRKKTKVKCERGGIKLLRTSNDFVKEQTEEVVVSTERKLKKRRKRKIENDSSSDEEKRAREVAVSAEWILSGEATKGWAPSTKGEVEVITVKSSKK